MTAPALPAAVPASDPLDGVTVQVPCTVPWETMKGDERRRFCGQCRLHVHDLSAMTRDEAIEILARRSAGQRVCIRFYRRPDGRVLTRDCNKAVAAIRRRAAIAAAAMLGILGLGAAASAARLQSRTPLSDPGTWTRQPFATLARILPSSWIPQYVTQGTPIPQGVLVLQGDVAAPPPAQFPQPLQGKPAPMPAPAPVPQPPGDGTTLRVVQGEVNEPPPIRIAPPQPPVPPPPAPASGPFMGK